MERKRQRLVTGKAVATEDERSSMSQQMPRPVSMADTIRFGRLAPKKSIVVGTSLARVTEYGSTTNIDGVGGEFDG